VLIIPFFDSVNNRKNGVISMNKILALQKIEEIQPLTKTVTFLPIF